MTAAATSPRDPVPPSHRLRLLQSNSLPYARAAHPQRCEYASKRCENPRAVKLNGERHRMCEHHRLLANKNQRRWQNRRKLLQHHEQARLDRLMVSQPAMLYVRSHPTRHPTAELAAEVQPQRATTVPSRIRLPPQPFNPLPSANAIETPPSSPSPSLLRLPCLRHHHVLSRALSLPVAPHVDQPGGEYGYGSSSRTVFEVCQDSRRYHDPPPPRTVRVCVVAGHQRPIGPYM